MHLFWKQGLQALPVFFPHQQRCFHQATGSVKSHKGTSGKSEAVTSTPPESQVSLAKSHPWDQAGQTGTHLYSTETTPKEPEQGLRREGCKIDVSNCALELTALHRLHHSPSLHSPHLASATQWNTSPYRQEFFLADLPSAAVFSSSPVPSAAENCEGTEQDGKGGTHVFPYWRLKAHILSRVWETNAELIS